MIFVQTFLKVLDNSGALIVQCIKVLKKSNKNGTIGDFLLITVKKVKSLTYKQQRSGKKAKIKKKGIYKCLVVRIKKMLIRSTGNKIYCQDNGIIFLNDQNVPIGSRIFGPFFNEIRNKKYSKIIVMAGLLL